MRKIVQFSMDRPLLFAGIVLPIFIIPFLALISFVWFMMWQQFQSAYYPHVPGTVLSSELREVHSRKTTTWSAIFKVQYEVNGVQYVSERGDFAGGSYNRGDGYELVEQHPVGSVAEVYYPPDRPFDGSIIVGLRPHHRATICVLSMFTPMLVLAGPLFAWYCRLHTACGYVCGRRIVERGSVTLLQPSALLRALWVAAWSFGMLLVGPTFVVFLKSLSEFSTAIIIGSCGVVAALIGLFVFQLARSESSAIVLDSARKELTTPGRLAIFAGTRVPYSEIQAVVFSPQCVGSSSNKAAVQNGEVSVRHGERETLVQKGTVGPSLLALARFIAERIGVPVEELSSKREGERPTPDAE